MRATTSASRIAEQVDQLMMGITLGSALVAVGIFMAIIYFSLRFHASRTKVQAREFQSTKLEITWIIVVLIIFMGFYLWGSETYKKQVAPGKPDYFVFVFAKQWMWKFHHQNGFVEIDELHIPVGRQVRFVMTSKDVIHSFFLPGFRIKQDVLPDTYTFLNIRPHTTGSWPLYCAEYCGTEHSVMKGNVEVLSEASYRELTNMGTAASLSTQGKALYKKMGCLGCHDKGPPSAPVLAGVIDDFHIRESILYPQKNISRGYTEVMPSYKEQISEEDVRNLIEYIKTMRQK